MISLVKFRTLVVYKRQLLLRVVEYYFLHGREELLLAIYHERARTFGHIKYHVTGRVYHLNHDLMTCHRGHIIVGQVKGDFDLLCLTAAEVSFSLFAPFVDVEYLYIFCPEQSCQRYRIL